MWLDRDICRMGYCQVFKILTQEVFNDMQKWLG